jgi:hypothetical protein
MLWPIYIRDQPSRSRSGHDGEEKNPSPYQKASSDRPVCSQPLYWLIDVNRLVIKKSANVPVDKINYMTMTIKFIIKRVWTNANLLEKNMNGIKNGRNQSQSSSVPETNVNKTTYMEGNEAHTCRPRMLFENV